MVFGQNTPLILREHLVWKASSVQAEVSAIFQQLLPYSKRFETLLRNILDLVFWPIFLDLQVQSLPSFYLFIFVLISSRLSSSTVTVLPRHVNSLTSSTVQLTYVSAVWYMGFGLTWQLVCSDHSQNYTNRSSTPGRFLPNWEGPCWKESDEISTLVLQVGGWYMGTATLTIKKKRIDLTQQILNIVRDGGNM